MIDARIETNERLSRVYEVLDLCRRSDHGFPVYGEVALLNGIPNQIGVAVADRRLGARWKLIPQSRVVEVAETGHEVDRIHNDYWDLKRPHLRQSWSHIKVGYVDYSMVSDIWESILKVGALPYDEVARAITPGPVWDLSRREFPEVYTSGRLFTEAFQRTLPLSSYILP